MNKDKLIEEFMAIKDGNSKNKRMKYEQLNLKFNSPYKNGRSLYESLRKLCNQKSDEFLPKTSSRLITSKSPTLHSSTKIIRAGVINDASELLKIHGLNPANWELISSKMSEWDSNVKDGSTEVFYSSKISVKPKTNSFDILDALSYVIDSPKIKIKHKPAKKVFSDKMLEIAFQDFHLGKLSWGNESGNDYNYKIAISRALSVIRDVMARANKYGDIEKVLFLIGGDMFHTDTPSGTTTAGTQMESDISGQKMFTEGLRLLISIIEALKEIAPVDVITVLGNHDTQTLMHAQVALAAYFKDDKDVNVDTKMTPRKYYQYGKCLIGFTHGDKEGKRMLASMPIEVSEMWGKSLFREIHAGHLHSEQTKEENGIILRHISSITETDSWHNKKGFIGAQKKLQSFIWDKNKGLLEIWNSPVKIKNDNIKEMPLF